MLNVDCIPAFEDNYIWLVHTGAGRAAVVDPGDAVPVLAALEQRGLALSAILITHHHRDHTGGIAALIARHAAPVYGPAAEPIPCRTHAVAEGDQMVIDDLRLRVLETPGHTRGHLCYLGEGALFCGDTLFTAGCGRLFEGTAAQMHASLEKLRVLPDETLVYCAHEYTWSNLGFARIAEPANAAIHARLNEVEERRRRALPTVPAPLGLEKATNPFLRCHEPALVAAAEGIAGRRLGSAAEVFGAVRQWKDSLD